MGVILRCEAAITPILNFPRRWGRNENSEEKPLNKKIVLFVLSISMMAIVQLSHAQQAEKFPRIGFLDPSTASGSAVLLEAFRQELRKLGWIEGKNFTIEYRFAEQKVDRLPELAADLIRLKVDLIVVAGGLPAWAAKKRLLPSPS